MIPIRTLLGLLVLVIGLGSCHSTPATPASPVSLAKPEPAWKLSGDTFAHDPTMIHVGSQYYLYFTGAGIPSKTSVDGRVWTDAGPVFKRPLAWWKKQVPGMTSGDVWAPDISFFHGTYWLFYAISTFGTNTSAIGLASTTDLAGGIWEDHGQVLSSDSNSSYNCIDPNLIVDGQGQPWLVFGSFWKGIFVTALDPVTLKPQGALVNVAYRPGDSQAIEGPCIVFNHGWYYLFTSRDLCCRGVDSTYKIAYARSTSITGPYVDRNGTPALRGGGTILDRTDGEWIGPGGQSVYQDLDGQWLVVHHSYDRDSGGRPTLRIKNLYFDGDGWPTYVKP